MLFLSVFIKSDFRAACFGLLWLWRALELVRDCHRKPQKCRLCVCVCMLSSTCACRVCSNYLIKLYLLRARVCVCDCLCASYLVMSITSIFHLAAACVSATATKLRLLHSTSILSTLTFDRRIVVIYYANILDLKFKI